MKFQFESSQGRHFPGAVNLLRSEDGSIYAECPWPDGAEEDYGYLRLKNSILLAMIDRGMVADGVSFWYDGQEPCLSEDAHANAEVYVKIDDETEETV